MERHASPVVSPKAATRSARAGLQHGIISVSVFTGLQDHRGNSQTHFTNAPTAEKTATAPLCKVLRGMCVIGGEGVLP